MSAKMALKPIPGAREISNADYHANPTHLSHSSLDVFGESKELYFARYIGRTIPHPEATPAMAQGTTFHAFVLQPNEAEGLIAVLPNVDGRTKEGKAAKAAFYEDPELAKKCIVTQEQYDTARAMADKLWSNPDAKAILEAPGWCEQSVFVEVTDPKWIIRGEDIPDTLALPSNRKAQFDKIFDTGHIADLKSTRHHNIDGFMRDVYTCGYHRQAPWYEDVRDLALGPHRAKFFYLVACTEPPYEVFVRPLSERAKAAGRIENHSLLMEYNRCVETGIWSNEDRGPVELDIPGWAHRKIEGQY